MPSIRRSEMPSEERRTRMVQNAFHCSRKQHLQVGRPPAGRPDARGAAVPETADQRLIARAAQPGQARFCCHAPSFERLAPGEPTAALSDAGAVAVRLRRDLDAHRGAPGRCGLGGAGQTTAGTAGIFRQIPGRRGDRKVAFRHHGPGWPAGFDFTPATTGWR